MAARSCLRTLADVIGAPKEGLTAMDEVRACFTADEYHNGFFLNFPLEDMVPRKEGGAASSCLASQPKDGDPEVLHQLARACHSAQRANPQFQETITHCQVTAEELFALLMDHDVGIGEGNHKPWAYMCYMFEVGPIPVKEGDPAGHWCNPRGVHYSIRQVDAHSYSYRDPLAFCERGSIEGARLSFELQFFDDWGESYLELEYDVERDVMVPINFNSTCEGKYDYSPHWGESSRMQLPLVRTAFCLSSLASKISTRRPHTETKILWRVVPYVQIELLESCKRAKAGDVIELKFLSLGLSPITGDEKIFKNERRRLTSELGTDGIVILRIHSRPTDASGFHSPVLCSDICFWPDGDDDHIIPPMSSALVLEADRQGDCNQVLDIDITFTPQLFPSMLRAPPAVWQGVYDKDVQQLRSWLDMMPILNLESPHEEYGCTLLYSAARQGNLEAVRLLVGRGARIDSQLSSKQSTPLHGASFFGHPLVVKFLLDHHADFSLKNCWGLTAFEDTKHTACKKVFEEHDWSRAHLEKDKCIEERQDLSGLGKFNAPHLKYGDRSSFLKGVRQYLGDHPQNLMPALEAEFSRGVFWTDMHAGWAPNAYNAQAEWQKALCNIGALMAKPEAQRIAEIDPANAEALVLALHLYTASPYKPLNDFLRLACDETTPADERAALLASNSGWPVFAHAVYDGFLALAKSGSIDDSITDLYRGIGMPLRPEFFIPDERGMVAAMELGFGSTSETPDVATNFAEAPGAAVIMNIKCCQRDAAGFHNGVKLAWVSAVPSENEVLFPPFTLFEVKKVVRKGMLTTLDVCPTWCE